MKKLNVTKKDKIVLGIMLLAFVAAVLIAVLV